MQCPYQGLLNGVCSNNPVALGFQSVEHAIRGIADIVSAESRMVATGRTPCLQSLHYRFHVFVLGSLLLVNMALNGRYRTPKYPTLAG